MNWLVSGPASGDHDHGDGDGVISVPVDRDTLATLEEIRRHSRPGTTLDDIAQDALRQYAASQRPAPRTPGAKAHQE